MTHFKLFLFGPPRLERHGAVVELQGRKIWALLAYLAVTGQVQSRDRLALLLWPDHDQAAARANLRRELSRLKTLLGAEQLWIEHERITLRREANLWLDITHFQACVQGCQTHSHAAYAGCPVCLPLLQEAEASYTADFLAGFTLADSPEFDEWQYFQSEKLRQDLAGALERLVNWHRSHSQFEPAIAYARRWLALDPLHEPVHRHLMELYASAGQWASALHQYAECQRILSEEMGVSPAEATKTLYEAIRTRRFPPDSQPQETGKAGQPEEQSATTDATTSQLSSPKSYRSLPPFLVGEEIQASPPPVFVGRARELADLDATLLTAARGYGQLIFVIGEAGQGKTVLVQEFARRAQEANADLLVVIGYCNAHTGIGDPYLPFREALTILAGEVEAKWAGGLLTTQHARRLWQAMPITVAALVEQAPELVGTFVPAKTLHARAATFAPTDAAWFRRLAADADDERGARMEEKQLFWQYTAALKAIAAQRPLLLILEDLHWVDTSSSALLFHLSRELGDSRILLIGTYRPDELSPGQGAGSSSGRHPLAGLVGELKRQHGDIWLDLDESTPVEGRHFVDAYLDTQPNRLGKAFRNGLFRQTGGHALFTVELLRDMQERGDLRQDEDGYWAEGDTINWQSLPAKVEGVLEKHLERLDAASQALLRVASVEGELFTAEVLARVQQADERATIQRLSHELDREHRLVTAQSLESLGQQRLSRYRFRHFLFQHYLYQTLDVVERAYLHEAVGVALEALNKGQVEQVAVQLAWHFEQAGLVEKAVGALLVAATRAQQLAAHQEASHHATKALALLKTLPDSPARDQQELNLQIVLGSALMFVHGYGAPAVESTFLRARLLCRQLGATAKLWPVLRGLWDHYLVRAELMRCRELAEELWNLSLDQPDLEPRLVAHTLLGVTLHELADFTSSTVHLEQALLIDHPQWQHDLEIGYTDHDLRIVSLGYLSVNRWLLGFPEQALRHSQEMLTLSTESLHSFITQIEAQHYSAWLYQLRREVGLAHKQSEVVLRLASEHHFGFWLAHAILYAGSNQVEQGQAPTGVERIRDGLGALRSTGQIMAESYHLTLLAKGYMALEQPEVGIEIITQALEFAERTGERWCEAEIYRVKGELLWMQFAPIDAIEACFWRAIDIARSQRAKSWELRSTLSLCRLWQQQGRGSEAHQMLMEIYNWFSEGFDTPDLQEARALLAARSDRTSTTLMV